MNLLNRRRERRIAEAVISDPTDHTEMDERGAVSSVQTANVDLPREALDTLWSATNLERLARTYWWYLSRISLGLIRVHYGPDERAVVFLTRPFVLLRFRPPDYVLEPDHGIVRWRIRDGLLVSRGDDGFLEIEVRRFPDPRPGYGRINVEVEVANFYPALARPFKWFYTNTQSRIHVVVTHGFLKRLARLELEESAVGRFAPQPVLVGVNGSNGSGGSADGHAPEPPGEDVTVGSTPWGVVAGLVAALLLVSVLVGWALRSGHAGRRVRRRGDR